MTLVLSTTGSKAIKRTLARMCWDDTHLYIGFECEDQDVWGKQTTRDSFIYLEEVVEVVLDPDCNLSRYFEFNVSPRNVIYDCIMEWDPGLTRRIGPIISWDCKGLRTAVLVDGTLDNRTDIDRGWTAELAIPFASLNRQAPKSGERWRANLYRIDLSPEPQEFQAWSPTMVTPADFHVPQRFGTVFFTE